jgi:hypothetical protein
MNIPKLLASLDKRIDICKSGQAGAESLTIAHSLMLMREVISEADYYSRNPSPPPIYSPAVRETAEAIAEDLLSNLHGNADHLTLVQNETIIGQWTKLAICERMKKHLGALEERLMRGP